MYKKLFFVRCMGQTNGNRFTYQVLDVLDPKNTLIFGQPKLTKYVVFVFVFVVAVVVVWLFVFLPKSIFPKRIINVNQLPKKM